MLMKKLFLFALALVMGLGSVQKMYADAEIYAVLNATDSILTLRYDAQREANNGVTDWSVYKNDTKIVLLDASMKNARPTTTSSWFNNFAKLAEIQHLDYLNTSAVTKMSSMFGGCKRLTTLDLSTFDTRNVTTMAAMFYNCKNLTSLDLSNFNTSAVINMGQMFAECNSLTALDLFHFNTGNVTNMRWMFSNCTSLASLDIYNFNTQNVTQMLRMFYNCSALTVLDVSRFNTQNVTTMDNMFSGCSSLTWLNVSSFDIQNVTDMSYMFAYCTNLVRIYCDADWSASTATDGNMFAFSTSLSGWNGTAYSNAHSNNKAYARPDVTGTPGYFSPSANAPIVPKSKFTITWKNYNDTVLAVTYLPLNATPVYPYDTPERISDSEAYDYDFTGWQPYLQVVTADATYTAQYQQTEKKFNVRFLDEDGQTVLYQTKVPYGGTPAYAGNTPTKAPEACCTHPFVGWNPDLVNFGGITQDTAFVAVYGSETRQYTVTFQIDPEHILQTGLWDYGVTPTYNGETPTQDNKQFIGWSPEISQVNGDAVYTAVFNDTYQITLANCEHGSIAVVETGVDLNAVVTGTVLHFNALPDEGYELDAWSGCNADGSLTVTANTTVSASFKKQTFVVTLVAEHGRIEVENEGIDLNAVEYGTALQLKAVPDEGYIFSSWQSTGSEPDNIISNTTITAYFEKLSEGLEAVFSGEHAAKIFRNGQIFILRGDKTYTLTGAEVK